MNPARAPAPTPEAQRLLLVDPQAGSYAHRQMGDLPDLVAPGDLVVVNDAATLPAALRAPGRDLEIRLVRRGKTDSEWTAVLFGRGDFRIPTEQREAPPALERGARLALGEGLEAEVVRVDDEFPRMIELRLSATGARLWTKLYRAARPVQYAYFERELPLSELQNRFASRPWALELPSAGHGLTWEL